MCLHGTLLAYLSVSVLPAFSTTDFLSAGSFSVIQHRKLFTTTWDKCFPVLNDGYDFWKILEDLAIFGHKRHMMVYLGFSRVHYVLTTLSLVRTSVFTLLSAFTFKIIIKFLCKLILNDKLWILNIHWGYDHFKLKLCLMLC